MLKGICDLINHNKNVFMLVTVALYITALVSVLTNHSIFVGVLINFCFLIVVLKEYLPVKTIFIWLFIFYFGIFNISDRIKDSDELLNIAPVNATIYGKIVSIPQIKDDNKTKFLFKVNKINYDNIDKTFNDEKTLVTINSVEKLNIFDSYKISGRLSVPFKAGNPSQFDYGNYLKNFGTYSVFYNNIDDENSFVKINSPNNKFEQFIQKINFARDRIINTHAKYLQTPNLEILGGIVFGDDAVSPPENIKQSFVNSGLLHILAASGMNVAFIFSFFYFILSFFRVNYKFNISFCILMVIIYSLMTGLGPSVIRATCMLVFVLIGKLIDRDANNIALLSFVAFLMLLYNPLYLNDVGFQLSFAATLGLLLVMPYIVKSENKIVNWTIGAVSVPIIAQLWVMPIQIFYFNNISLYSVFANIMSVPILSIISIGGFLSSLFSLVMPDVIIRIFDTILNPLINLLVNISDFWGTLKNATLQTSHPSIIQIILYYAILLCVTALLNGDLREKYFNKIRNSIFIIIVILGITAIPYHNNNLEILTFDVGNADSFLIKTPKNEYVMIDTAKSGYNGGKSQAEIILLKYLRDNGIKSIDTIIITHFDNDHCGGTADIIKNIKVKNIYVNTLEHDSIAAKEIYKTAKQYGVNLISAQNNQIIKDENGFIIKNYISENVKENDDNESSIITLVQYNKFKMLFTGDAGVRTLKVLKQYLPEKINVFKVGHHGAVGVINRDLMNYLNPEISIISTGQNKFGHPSVLTLDILKSSKVLRTDNNNSIKIKVNKNNYAVYIYDIKNKRYSRIRR